MMSGVSGRVSGYLLECRVVCQNFECCENVVVYQSVRWCDRVSDDVSSTVSIDVSHSLSALSILTLVGRT